MTSNSYMPSDPFAGQQIWTSLMHNGVIFSSPYEPHGVKMLYNGEPVYLTPEQEEVFPCLLLLVLLFLSYSSFYTQVFNCRLQRCLQRWDILIMWRIKHSGIISGTIGVNCLAMTISFRAWMVVISVQYMIGIGMKWRRGNKGVSK